MLRQPVTLVSQLLHVLRQVDRSGNRAARGLPGSHAYKIQYRKSQPVTHNPLDESHVKAMRTLFDGYQAGKSRCGAGNPIEVWSKPPEAKVAEGSQERVPLTGFPTLTLACR